MSHKHDLTILQFTDITKIDRATKALAKNASKKRLAESNEPEESESNNPKPQKVPRNTRRSFEKHVSWLPYVLPKICLICKH